MKNTIETDLINHLSTGSFSEGEQNMQFIKQSLPAVGEFIVPNDLILKLPDLEDLIEAGISKEFWHFLLFIPWKNEYLASVPADFQEFFKHVLPQLGARTTDVHTARSMNFLDELISKFPELDINRRVVAISLILHDAGWSRLSYQEIANSLGVTGLKLTDIAMGPKVKHAVESENIARDLLGGIFQFEPPLTEQEKELIFKAIRFHDKPEEVAGAEVEMPIEVKLLVDLDHL